MGANQSSEPDHGHGEAKGGKAKTCYYELLGVDKTVSDDEIKKAYRKKALELHPDRNFGNVETTTKLFAEIQAAYEVLADPQERAWYDSHRDAILRDEGAPGGDHFEHNVRITTAEDIVRMYMRFDGHLEYSDSQTGFYQRIGGLFDTLAKEETAACDWEGLEPVTYPSFGSSKDTYNSAVRGFYTVWTSFATKKTFSWKDLYRNNEAPDRRVRRMMEKENKRIREDGIREFNEAVRALVAFVKKRDPRYTPSKQSQEERQKSLRAKAAAQAARSRAANEARLKPDVIPSWAAVSDPSDAQMGEDAEETQEQYECVVCKKIFKSENQWEAHEKSKKHIKAVRYLRRRMQIEDEAIGLETLQSESNITTRTPSVVDGNDSDCLVVDFERPIDSEESVEPSSPADANEAEPASVIPETNAHNHKTTSSVLDKDYRPKDNFEDRTSGAEANDSDKPASFNHDNDHDNVTEKFQSASRKDKSSTTGKSNLGKAKEKRAKQAAKKTAAAADSQQEFKCAACQADFLSKTRLFNHINDFGHAQPAPKPASGKKGWKR